MNVVMNLGNPRKKTFNSVVASILENSDESELQMTGVGLFRSAEVVLTSPAYGAGMTLDTLTEMESKGVINRGDHLIFVGSMGSCSQRIDLGDLVTPNPCLCAYYGFSGVELTQDSAVLTAISSALRKHKKTAKEYRHGSTFAVYDPHANHESYTTDIYDASIEGVDIGEVFIGFEFAKRRGVAVGALLYCSDSPSRRISDIPSGEFSRRAAGYDLIINRVAMEALQGLR